jgi:hypothetical protein
MFEINKNYTREYIHTVCGGSKQAFLPTRNGKVVAACERSVCMRCIHAINASHNCRSSPMVQMAYSQSLVDCRFLLHLSWIGSIYRCA